MKSPAPADYARRETEDEPIEREHNGRLLVVTKFPKIFSDIAAKCDMLNKVSQAVVLAKRSSYQTIFCDTAELADRLPGFRLPILLKREEVDTPVYLMTNSISKPVQVHARRHGALDVIPRDPVAVLQASVQPPPFPYVERRVRSVPVIEERRSAPRFPFFGAPRPSF